jgi:hypothetical protein
MQDRSNHSVEVLKTKVAVGKQADVSKEEGVGVMIGVVVPRMSLELIGLIIFGRCGVMFFGIARARLARKAAVRMIVFIVGEG